MKMPLPGPLTETSIEPAVEELANLRQFTGQASEFWPALLGGMARLARAHRGVLVRRDPAQPERLLKVVEWSDNTNAHRTVSDFNRSLPDLANTCLRDKSLLQPIETTRLSGSGHFAVGVNLHFAGDREQCAALLLMAGVTDSQAREALTRLRLASDVPRSFQGSHAAIQARQDVERFAAVLDLLVLVNAETRFRSAALAFCNALATRFHCQRVSLGWLEGGFVRLKTISRTERFDKHMSAVKAIEVVMEEALDQDDEVLWPLPAALQIVARDHERFSREQGVAHLVSLPLRLDDKPVAAITCERREQPFSETEVRQLRLAADQVARRLSELRRRDRWFGARWATSMRERFAKWLGPEHTWAKVLVLIGVMVVVALLLPIYPYRIEGTFILRSEEASYLTAPFDGYIKSVQVRPGDDVAAGAALLNLNTADLELEEAAAVADQTRYLREAEKARAAGELAEMRIAQALADQAKSRLDLVRHRLNQAGIQAPFAGVVIEGDLRERIGAPVRQGDLLFRVARLEPVYIEAEINERNVREVLGRTEGEMAFVSQPKRKYPIHVVRVEPAAVPKEKQNVFLVRCAPVNPPDKWWRPGMSGVCKLDVEKRTLFWILTHRTVDFLRMLLWW